MGATWVSPIHLRVLLWHWNSFVQRGVQILLLRMLCFLYGLCHTAGTIPSCQPANSLSPCCTVHATHYSHLGAFSTHWCPNHIPDYFVSPSIPSSWQHDLDIGNGPLSFHHPISIMPASLPAGPMDFAIPNDSFKQITLVSSALAWPDAKFVLYSQSN
jgi:hypothetical protein